MRRYGLIGQRLFHLSRGQDSRQVHTRDSAKSISSETTFNHDYADAETLVPILRSLSEKVSRRLKKNDMAGQTVVLKLKSADFRIRTRNRRLDDPTCLADRIFRTGLSLLSPELDGTRYRLLGIGVTDLKHSDLADPPDLVDEAADPPAVPDRLRILSPFDPALRDRNRTERLFGFHYRIEVFVPAEKRRYGYYVFPVMERDRLIGRIDMKRNVASGALEVAGFWPERGVVMGKGRLRRLDGELARIARFAGCGCVDHRDGWLREAS